MDSPRHMNSKDDGFQKSQQKSRHFNDPTEPTHTVFFHSIDFSTKKQDFEDYCAQFGEIASFYPIITTRGLAFVTYYDIRDATRAVQESNGKEYNGRELKASFAFRAANEKQKSLFSLTSNLELIGNTKPSSISVEEIKQTLATYGEIRSCTGDQQNGVFNIKYYNIKDAKKVLDSSPITINNEKFEVLQNKENESEPEVPVRPEKSRPEKSRDRGHGRRRDDDRDKRSRRDDKRDRDDRDDHDGRDERRHPPMPQYPYPFPYQYPVPYAYPQFPGYPYPYMMPPMPPGNPDEKGDEASQAAYTSYQEMMASYYQQMQ